MRGLMFACVVGGASGCATLYAPEEARAIYVPRGDAHHLQVEPGREVFVPNPSPGAKAPAADGYPEDPPPPEPASSR